MAMLSFSGLGGHLASRRSALSSADSVCFVYMPPQTVAVYHRSNVQVIRQPKWTHSGVEGYLPGGRNEEEVGPTHWGFGTGMKDQSYAIEMEAK